jgi:hypothetical protein
LVPKKFKIKNTNIRNILREGLIYEASKKDILFESYIDLISEELLDEVKWVTNKNDKLRNGDIPLTPSIVKRLFDKPRVIEAFHVTDLDNVFDITKIIGKRNSISAFKYFSESNIRSARGIQTQGGIVLKIGGIMDIMGSDDIMSSVDTSVNRRWISASKLSKRLYDDLINYFSTFKFNDNPSDVRTYMTHMFQLFDKYHDEIQDNLIRMVFGSTFDNGWNELLVKNVRVLSLAWYPNKAMDHYDTDEEREEATNEIIEKLKTLTPNVYTFYDDDDMVEWFKENGGHIELDNFRKAEFGNYKKEDLMKSMGGLIAMIKYDYDYFASNFDKIKHFIIQKKDDSRYPYREIVEAAEKTGRALDIAKLIFTANGKDWDEYDNIQKLVNQIPSGDNTEFFIWLLDFFGRNIDNNIFRAIMKNVDINQKFVDYVFSVFGKTENTINWLFFKDPSSLEFMGELSGEIQKNIIMFNPIAIRYIKNPSEELKLSSVLQNGLLIQHFENPSESLQRAAINSNYQAIKFINNPSEAIEMAAIKRFGSTKYDVISFINNPSENAKLEAVNQNGYAIQFIDNPSEAVQIAAVKNKEQSYFYIKNPTDNVKRMVGVIDESRKNIRKILRS